jgi:hypothetical protein
VRKKQSYHGTLLAFCPHTDARVRPGVGSTISKAHTAVSCLLRNLAIARALFQAAFAAAIPLSSRRVLLQRPDAVVAATARGCSSVQQSDPPSVARAAREACTSH